MSDVRALLAAERQSRRISHPYLTYTKSGQLLCNVCQLNVKSETLWEGHLKSANHKKKVRAAQDASSRSLKRKLEDVEEGDEDAASKEEETTRNLKKPKSRAVSLVENGQVQDVGAVPGIMIEPADQSRNLKESSNTTAMNVIQPEGPSQTTLPQPSSVDEDEWAAFEREVAPLAQNRPETNYTNLGTSGAVITAAPVTAEELARRKDEERRKQQEIDAEAEKEEEDDRVLQDVEIMEDLAEKVRKLKERREALRMLGKDSGGGDVGDGPDAESIESRVQGIAEGGEQGKKDQDQEEDDSDDDDDVDDWYS
jgi:zinc finger protein 830